MIEILQEDCIECSTCVHPIHPPTHLSNILGEPTVEPAWHREDTDKVLALMHVIFSVQATQLYQ